MRSTINHLNQLQELTLIRDEQRSIRGAKADLKELDDSIASLTQTLTEPAKTIYLRLSRADHIVMSPMVGTRCAVCGMSLAISLVQSVKQCRTLVACPSCARLLYDSGAARWIADTPKRTAERKVGIARFSAPTLMIPDIKSDTPRGAIEELSSILQEAKFVDDASKLVSAAIGREETLSTSVGKAMAFPHVRGVEGGGLALAFGISRQGIQWSPSDKELTHFIFFSIIPTAVSVFYLKLLAGISESFSRETNRKAALGANTQEDLWKVLVKATRTTVK